MSYEVLFRPSARKQLDGLPANLRAHVIGHTEALAVVPRPPGSRALLGKMKGLRRIRVGDYRVIYEVDDAARRVIVTTIGHGHSAYGGI